MPPAEAEIPATHTTRRRCRKLKRRSRRTRWNKEDLTEDYSRKMWNRSTSAEDARSRSPLEREYYLRSSKTLLEI